jgi:hypothetical protein
MVEGIMSLCLRDYQMQMIVLIKKAKVRAIWSLNIPKMNRMSFFSLMNQNKILHFPLLCLEEKILNNKLRHIFIKEFKGLV